MYQALAMQDGARKYGPYNWRVNKVIASIYVDAALRHLLQWLDGEELTSDTKVPNLGAALACIGIIVDAKENGNLIDDRPRVGPASELIERLTSKTAEEAQVAGFAGSKPSLAGLIGPLMAAVAEAKLRKGLEKHDKEHPSDTDGSKTEVKL